MQRTSVSRPLSFITWASDELEASSPDEEGEGELMDFETRAEELQTSPVMRAKSVEYKGHARHISAGSAKLLDIRRSSGPLESTSPSARPVSAVKSQEEKGQAEKPVENPVDS